MAVNEIVAPRSDPDGSLQSYHWTEGGTAIAGAAAPTVSLAAGEHTLTLTVTDDGGASDTDTVQISILPAPTPAADKVSILTASYHSRRGQLTIEASSSDAPNVTLTAYDGEGAPLGQLSYNRKKGIYTGTFKIPSAPALVLVVSSGGGSDTRAVAGG